MDLAKCVSAVTFNKGAMLVMEDGGLGAKLGTHLHIRHVLQTQ